MKTHNRPSNLARPGKKRRKAAKPAPVEYEPGHFCALMAAHDWPPGFAHKCIVPSTEPQAKNGRKMRESKKGHAAVIHRIRETP